MINLARIPSSHHPMINLENLEKIASCLFTSNFRDYLIKRIPYLIIFHLFFAMRYINTFLFSLHCLIASAETKKSCQFSRDFKCLDFTSPDRVNRYIHEVSKWEGLFAQPGIGYDSKTGKLECHD